MTAKQLLDIINDNGTMTADDLTKHFINSPEALKHLINAMPLLKMIELYSE